MVWYYLLHDYVAKDTNEGRKVQSLTERAPAYADALPFFHHLSWSWEGALNRPPMWLAKEDKAAAAEATNATRSTRKMVYAHMSDGQRLAHIGCLPQRVVSLRECTER
mmetsp:Transcript_36813/g.73384  ORF Transcript_36813/g.73384 Transcript_36813/m.73384 type:complete len:108 (-) Transcript_36813:261-584(-)